MGDTYIINRRGGRGGAGSLQNVQSSDKSITIDARGNSVDLKVSKDDESIVIEDEKLRTNNIVFRKW